jgi:hypothetical protein
LPCKKETAKSKEVKTGWSNSRQHSQEWTSLAESAKEGYGSKRAIFSMLMMIGLL